VYKWFFQAAILFLPVAALGQAAETPQSSSASPTAPSYAQSNDGFRSQADAILQSYQAVDATTGHQLIDQLRLPHPDRWFSEHLGSEQSAKLMERYDRLFANYSESLEKTIEAVVANHESKLATDLKDGNGETPTTLPPRAKLSGMVSIKQPHLFYCHFEITVKNKDSVSWADTFVYEEGAFRFIGFGGWPFWVWEDGTEGGAPKGGHFFQPAILISKVSPVYPANAKARGLEGVVVIHAVIDKEGRVKRADVQQGDPLLTQAALDAFKQWRYKPSTLGGAPAETEVTASVTFQLH
jgi:TonB family protein